jgi:hypothetical protein
MFTALAMMVDPFTVAARERGESMVLVVGLQV